MESQQVSVLIVGAGPTGLLLACELARYGMSFKIIDKKSEPTKTSNAAGIQPRTVELFADIGIANRFIDAGIPCQRMNFRYNNHTLLQFDVGTIDSLYKYILFLPQCDTEKLLSAHLNELGGKIDRSVEFLDFVEMDSGIKARLINQNGVEEWVMCDWLVGCDGAHSVVRNQAGIMFPGDEITEQFVVADGEMEMKQPLDEVNIFASDGTVLAAFPLGHDRYRIAANLLTPVVDKVVTDDQVKTLVSERSGKEVNVRSIHWASPFWIHSKMANAMRKGRVFLAGDAAHIHSPVGGQGMNTGIQDAYNLAWKLAYVLQEKVSERLLDSYQIERQQVIRKVVDTSDRLTKALIATNKLGIFLRNQVMRIINTQPWIKKKILMRLTQLDICYQGVGERFRDVVLEDGRHLHDYLDKKKFNIVLVGEVQASVISGLEERHGDRVSVVNIKQRFYGNKTAAVYVVRPDMYVCYQGSSHADTAAVMPA